jgi:hypothetical protein
VFLAMVVVLTALAVIAALTAQTAPERHGSKRALADRTPRCRAAAAASRARPSAPR